MATNLDWIVIVPQVLGNGNYENWRIFLEDYLRGQDLWDVITEPKPEEYDAEFKTWRKKNFMALHAIKISCGREIFSEIKTTTSAKYAWDFLAKMQMQQPQEFIQPRGLTEVPGPQRRDYYWNYVHGAVLSDEWDGVNDFLRQYPDAVRVKLNDEGHSTLHIAVKAGSVKIVEKLVRIMSQEDLEIQDIYGFTALYLAARIGHTQMAKWMIRKNGKLVSIANKTGEIPVVRASINGLGDMVRYLYTMTPLEELTPDKGKNGATLLSYCIVFNLFDVALDLLRNHPPLAFTLDEDGNSPVFILSRMPSAFPSRCPLGFWKHWIYSRIRVQPTIASTDVRINIHESHQGQTDRGSIVLPGMKHIYNQKLIHLQARELLGIICAEIRTLGSKLEAKESLIGQALFQAVKHGIVELVMEITGANPNLLWIIDDNGRNLFQCAITYRQEKIFSLVYGLDIESMRKLKTAQDRFRNNMLHSAAMLAPPSRLDGISGAALQIQRELQWFKEVENFVPPMFKEIRNSNGGQTPRELFTEKHRDLLNEGQKWMKEAATSCMVVATLIVTIMFGAVFTFPGGTKQDTGFPLFAGEKLFMVFLLFDVLSFFASSASVLTFLGIFVSCHGEEYFLESLPKKMIIGLVTLFVSILTMVIAFSTALFLMLQEKPWWFCFVVILLASFPILLVNALHFPMLIEIYFSSYGSGIFNRKQERWY